MVRSIRFGNRSSTTGMDIDGDWAPRIMAMKGLDQAYSPT